MGIMKKASLYMKARAVDALERLEDPRETLEYSYHQQLEALAKIQRGVADVASSWAYHDSLREQEERLAVACEHLTSKIEAFRVRMETVKASYGAADAQQRAAGVSRRISDEADNARPAVTSRSRRLEMLEQLRLSIEEIAAARERLVLQAGSLRQQLADLKGAAGQALAPGRENQAERASARKAKIDGKLSDLVAQCQSLQAPEHDAAMVCERLAAKLEAIQQQEAAVQGGD